MASTTDINSKTIGSIDIDNRTNVYNNINQGTYLINSRENKKIPKNFQFGLPPVVNITGRDGDVKKLTEHIKTEQRIVISGMGGVGKTSLSAHCARKWSEGGIFRRWLRIFEHVIFIDTETDLTIDNSIRGLCDHPDIGIRNYDNQRRADIMQIIYQKFKRGKLLVIFDNVISFPSVKDYLPPKERHNIITILTSQNREFDFYVYKLKPLNKKTCLVLIKDQFGEQWRNMENQQEEIEKLMEKLEFLPLAVCQAVTHIKDQLTFGDCNYKIKKYLDNFEVTFQGSFPEYKDEICKKTVFAAIEINISRLEQDKKYGKRAKFALYCMGYLDPSSISEELLLPLFGLEGDDILEVKRLLQKYSLVDSDNKYINIHRLIQETCRILSKDYREFNNYFKNVLKEFISSDIYRSHLQFLKPYIDNFGLDILNEIYREMFSAAPRKEVLKAALESVKYDISAVEGWTVMHYALFENNWDVLNLLEKSGQNFIDNNTALYLLLSGEHNIIDYSCKRCSRALQIIQSGYDNNIVNKYDDTLAHLTFVNSHFEIVKYLLRYCNIDIFLKNNQGEDINTLAEKKHISLYKITSFNHDRSWYESAQLKPLSRLEEGVALLKGQLNQSAPDAVWEEIVKLFDNIPQALRLTGAYIQHMQLPVSYFEEHFTAMSEKRVHESFRENCYGYDCQNINMLLYIILENLKNNNKLSYTILLYLSCEDGWLGVYRLLYKYRREDIDTNIKELEKWFLLEKDKFGRYEVPDIVKCSTVMYSLERGDLEDVCVALITYGRAGGLAVRYLGVSGVQKAYMDWCNSEPAARPEWLNKLCELKLVTEEDIGHFTALHWALGCANKNVIRELLRMGVPANTATARGYNVNACDVSGNTPAHWAALVESRGIVSYLQQHGADLTMRNNKGQTPVDILKSKNLSI